MSRGSLRIELLSCPSVGFRARVFIPLFFVKRIFFGVVSCSSVAWFAKLPVHGSGEAEGVAGVGGGGRLDDDAVRGGEEELGQDRGGRGVAGEGDEEAAGGGEGEGDEEAEEGRQGDRGARTRRQGQAMISTFDV